MPISPYGVLKGVAYESRPGTGSSPHIQIRIVDDDDTHYRIAINVKSGASPSELLYLIVDDFQHPILDDLKPLPSGWSELPSSAGSGAFDYIRGNLFTPCDMVPLPHSVSGPDNDLNEKIGAVIQSALTANGAVVYALGERWGPDPGSDRYFGFSPKNGIHDIHMNQGNISRWEGDDGVWQDGGLLVHLPNEGPPGSNGQPVGRWRAVFLAFQSQAWHTDDGSGHKIGPVGPDTRNCSAGPVDDPIDPISVTDNSIRIVAAQPNPVGGHPEPEFVVLVNTTPQAIDLQGWGLLDKNDFRFDLAGTLAGGGVLKVHTAQPFALSNKGGLVTIVDSAGLKVHGVSYTKEQAKREGWTLVF